MTDDLVKCSTADSRLLRLALIAAATLIPLESYAATGNQFRGNQEGSAAATPLVALTETDGRAAGRRRDVRLAHAPIRLAGELPSDDAAAERQPCHWHQSCTFPELLSILSSKPAGVTTPIIAPQERDVRPPSRRRTRSVAHGPAHVPARPPTAEANDREAVAVETVRRHNRPAHLAREVPLRVSTPRPIIRRGFAWARPESPASRAETPSSKPVPRAHLAGLLTAALPTPRIVTNASIARTPARLALSPAAVSQAKDTTFSATRETPKGRFGPSPYGSLSTEGFYHDIATPVSAPPKTP